MPPDPPVETIQFRATEAGDIDGVAGASNSKAGDPYHYVLFGAQNDPQHPKNSGMYFEYDGQFNGRVNLVTKTLIENDEVVFFLRNGSTITVRSNDDEGGWDSFIQAIQRSFLTEDERT